MKKDTCFSKKRSDPRKPLVSEKTLGSSLVALLEFPGKLEGVLTRSSKFEPYQSSFRVFDCNKQIFFEMSPIFFISSEKHILWKFFSVI